MTNATSRSYLRTLRLAHQQYRSCRSDLTAKATEQRLAGEALFTLVKRCEVDAQMACADAAHKMLAEPASQEFIHTCVAKAIGAGPRWRMPHHCRNNSDCTGGSDCDNCWAGVCGQ